MMPDIAMDNTFITSSLHTKKIFADTNDNIGNGSTNTNR
jgi:hypothetical protein